MHTCSYEREDAMVNHSKRMQSDMYEPTSPPQVCPRKRRMHATWAPNHTAIRMRAHAVPPRGSPRHERLRGGVGYLFFQSPTTKTPAPSSLTQQAICKHTHHGMPCQVESRCNASAATFTKQTRSQRAPCAKQVHCNTQRCPMVGCRPTPLPQTQLTARVRLGVKVRKPKGPPRPLICCKTNSEPESSWGYGFGNGKPHPIHCPVFI